LAPSATAPTAAAHAVLPQLVRLQHDADLAELYDAITANDPADKKRTMAKTNIRKMKPSAVLTYRFTIDVPNFLQ
jgi:hypothetical protein